MQEVLNLPHFVSLEYKRHDASLTDNSSFRNTTLWRSDSGKVAADGSSSATNREGQRSSGSGHRSSSGTSGGANQKDTGHRGGERGERSDRTERSERSERSGDGSTRFSRDRFEKQASSSGTSGHARSGWRESGGSASANKSRSFTKSASSAGEDGSGGSERPSSSDRPNAWQQK